MTKYELMVIIDNDNDQTTAEKICKETVIEKIKEAGGTPTFEDFWGERGFAYKINKKTWGYYFVVQFDAPNTTVDAVKKELNIQKQIVRFLATKVDKNAPAPRKYAEMKAEYEAQEKTKKEEIEAAKTKKSNRREKLTTIKKDAQKKDEAPKKDAVDKKLDNILDESSKGI